MSKGPTGPTGPQGIPGLTGPAGMAGTSLLSFHLVDSTNWTGSVTTVTYDVSSVFSVDATKAFWRLERTGSLSLQILCDIDFPTATTVRVTTDLPLAAGSYTIIGIGL